jgi:four helix bundle protein
MQNYNSKFKSGLKTSASSSRLEFKKFHEIVLKSANETKYWLGLLRDFGKEDKKMTNKLLSEVAEIANMIAAGVMKLKNKNFNFLLTFLTFDF